MNEYPSDRFHEAFNEAIASTGLTPAQVARHWSAETDKDPLAMQMTLGRWAKRLPKTIVDLVSLLDALDFEIIIQRRSK